MILSHLGHGALKCINKIIWTSSCSFDYHQEASSVLRGFEGLTQNIELKKHLG